jgi:hypothetical protein
MDADDRVTFLRSLAPAYSWPKYLTDVSLADSAPLHRRLAHRRLVWHARRGPRLLGRNSAARTCAAVLRARDDGPAVPCAAHCAPRALDCGSRGRAGQPAVNDRALGRRKSPPSVRVRVRVYAEQQNNRSVRRGTRTRLRVKSRSSTLSWTGIPSFSTSAGAASPSPGTAATSDHQRHELHVRRRKSQRCRMTHQVCSAVSATAAAHWQCRARPSVAGVAGSLPYDNKG